MLVMVSSLHCGLLCVGWESSGPACAGPSRWNGGCVSRVHHSPCLDCSRCKAWPIEEIKQPTVLHQTHGDCITGVSGVTEWCYCTRERAGIPPPVNAEHRGIYQQPNAKKKTPPSGGQPRKLKTSTVSIHHLLSTHYNMLAVSAAVKLTMPAPPPSASPQHPQPCQSTLPSSTRSSSPFTHSCPSPAAATPHTLQPPLQPLLHCPHAVTPPDSNVTQQPVGV